MTTPNAPDNNDDIIKVVYQAVADYSQLLRETRRAREETNALKRDLDGLAGTSTHKVKVTVDSAQAKAEIAAVLRDVVVKAKVTVDAAAARTELGALLKDVVVKAKVVVDAAAKSQLTDRLKDTVVKVQVAVDAAAARAELRRTFADNIVIGGKLVVDTVAARAEIARATRDATIKVRVLPDVSRINNLAGFFADKVVKVTVALDEHGITERFRALLAHLESMGPVEIELAIKASAIDRIDAAAERLRRIRDDLQSGGGGPPDPAPPRPAPPRGGGGSSSSSSKEILPEGLTAAAGLVLKFLPLIAAAVPVAASLALGIGAIVAALSAAAGTAAIFAVGAVGAFAKVTAAVQAYEKSGTIAAGPLGQVVSEFEALKNRYSELQKATQDDVFAVFSRGLQIAADLLDKVQPLISTTAHAIDDALGQVQAAVDGAGLQSFLDFVGRQGPGAVAGFTRGLIGLGGGVGKLIMAFEPLITVVVKGFGDMGVAFDRWAGNLSASGKFQAFLDYAIANTPKLVDLIKNLVVFAAHLLSALAPVGSVLLSVANSALRFVNAINPAELRAVVVVVLAVAAAIKAMQAVIAITTFAGKWSEAITKIRTSAGQAGGAAGGLKSALVGLAAAAVVTVGMLAINNWLQKTADLQNEAADAAARHQAALASVADAINNGQDPNSAQVRGAQYDTLMGLSATGKSGGVLGFGQTKETVNFSDVAKAAGISAADLTTGSLGIDPHVQSQNIGKLEAYRRELLDQAAAGGKNADSLKAQADAVEQLETQYGAQSLAVGEATQAANDHKAAQDGDTTSAGKATAGYKDQAAVLAAVKKALKADFSSDANTQAYDQAEQAMQAYDQQVQAVKDAETAYTDAQTAATRAQQDLNAARVAAVQRIRDLQRSLRDMAVDERQAKLSAKESDENLAKLYANGASADELEQAKIDNERAHNALNDLEQDKASKKKAATDELAAGVAGNRALQDAVRSNQTAQNNLTKAHTALTNATTQLTDLHLAFDTAAGALGLTEGQIRALKTNMDALKNKTVKVILDTSSAEGKLTALLQGQHALQLTAANPKLSLAQALAQAAKQVPTVAAAKKTAAPATVTAPSFNVPAPGSPAATRTFNFPVPGSPGYAAGGPAGPVQGPVRGPGTGTSDSVPTRLPVGGDVRLSHGEHIVTDAEVKAAPGGHNYLEAFRAGLRAGQPWAPPAPRYGGGGRAVAPPAVWSAALPTFRVPVATPPVVPGYAGGGAVATAARTVTSLDRSVTVNVGTINNPVAEPAGTSLYKQVRKAIEGDEGGR